ncbi:MAG TPA: PilZ domain-containing protein [bacterium]|jgi:hypothetical protein|nr:PilZ domain-containing protein [bacterium]
MATPTIEANGVLAHGAPEPRRPKATDHRFRVSFSVLPTAEALRRLPHIDGDPSFNVAPDNEDGICYAPYGNEQGMGIHGELKTLAQRSLKRGDFVKMEIRAQGKSHRIRCLGEVTWVRVNRDADLFYAGVSFVGVDQRDLDKA